MKKLPDFRVRNVRFMADFNGHASKYKAIKELFTKHRRTIESVELLGTNINMQKLVEATSCLKNLVNFSLQNAFLIGRSSFVMPNLKSLTIKRDYFSNIVYQLGLFDLKTFKSVEKLEVVALENTATYAYSSLGFYINSMLNLKHLILKCANGPAAIVNPMPKIKLEKFEFDWLKNGNNTVYYKPLRAFLISQKDSLKELVINLKQKSYHTSEVIEYDDFLTLVISELNLQNFQCDGVDIIKNSQKLWNAS